MAACNPSATPAYIDFPFNAALYLEDIFFPPEALPDQKALYLQKPGQMGAQRILHWMIHILARQERYLAGEEGVLPFRWLCYKDGDDIVDAKYTPAWMMAYTNGLRLPPNLTPNPTPTLTGINIAADTTTTTQPPELTIHDDATETATPHVRQPPSEGSSRLRQPARKTRTSRSIDEDDSGGSDADQVDVMIGGGDDEDYEEEEEDLPLSAIREYGSEDEQQEYEDDEDEEDEGEEDDEEDKEEDRAEPQPVVGGGKSMTVPVDKGKGVLRPGRRVTFTDNPSPSPKKSGSRPRNTKRSTPAQRASEVRDSLDLIIAHLGEDNVEDIPLIAPAFSAPCWVAGDNSKKVAFLRALSTNQHYQAIVQFYSSQEVRDTV